MERKSAFSWPYFLMGILFILVSLVSFREPQSSLVAIVYVFAFSAILKGLFELFFRRKLHEFTNQKSTLMMVLGIVDILIGLFFLFNITAGLVALPFVFAIWFIFDSIVGLLTAGIYKLESTGYYWFHIVIDVIGVVLGFMLLFNPLTSALTLAFLVGFYFMMVGISLISYAF